MLLSAQIAFIGNKKSEDKKQMINFSRLLIFIDLPFIRNCSMSNSDQLGFSDSKFILCQAIDEGLNERKMDKDKEPQQKDKKVMRKELETKDFPAAIIEAIVEEEEEEAEEEDEVDVISEDEEEEITGITDETEEEEEE